MTWNVGKLQRLAKGLAGIPARASKGIAARLRERVLDCYRGEHDPYLTPWEPLKPSTIKRKGGDSVILHRTGASGNDCGARALAGGGVAVYAGGAAVHHMQAAGTRPARPVLPTRGLPPLWRDDVSAELGAEKAKALGRATR